MTQTLEAPLPTPATASKDATRGAALGITAYLLWGIVLPLYLHRLSGKVPPSLILAHRVVWSILLLAVILFATKRWNDVITALRNRRAVKMLTLSTLLICANWFTFTYVSTHGQILQAAVGYFITPMISSLLGVFVLRERLRPMQWVSLSLAMAGVIYLGVGLGVTPKAALILALTWGLYGLVRKTAPVDAIAGLTVETAILLPISVVYLAYAHLVGMEGGQPAAPLLVYLAVGCGLCTTVPLLCFNRAARLLPLSTLGFLQYIGPTGQFAVAVYYGEPFGPVHRVAFGLIWAAVILFAGETLFQLRRRAMLAT